MTQSPSVRLVTEEALAGGDFVRLTGDQTIEGAKDFTTAPTVLGEPIGNTAYGLRPSIYANISTGTWGSRTLPPGYTGIVIWDSIDYERATSDLAGAPTGMVDGDHWRRVKR